MALAPTSSTNNSSPNEVVTATVTRTITTTDTDGNTATVFTATDEKSVILGGGADESVQDEYGFNPVSVKSVTHTEQVATNLSDDLNSDLMVASVTQEGDTADVDPVQQMLMGMLQSGLNPRSPNDKRVVPNSTSAHGKQKGSQNPLNTPRTTGHNQPANPPPQPNHNGAQGNAAPNNAANGRGRG
ncbi:hypothetical protein BDY19DRAFT_905351 [Irpex rosettiformis]|uniref:Uncharacterized protein n=1 Tax=Irpex rosettiformis TaxID=378272 RepID=A0ACB8U7Y1_9APHY|nr:hypothetical protein BDY19DRAFT_905351 [Irpex rosettiformis]